MRKTYARPTVKIEYAVDVISTSAEVETGKIPFPFASTAAASFGLRDVNTDSLTDAQEGLYLQ